MRALRVLLTAAVLTVPLSAFAADDILDAIDAARKAYQGGDMAGAKQSIDTASQLIAQKNAEAFSALLPKPLAGWTAEKAQSNAVGTAMFGGVSSASRSYTNAKGDTVEVSISGDSAMIMQFGPMLNNPAMAGAMGARGLAVEPPKSFRTALHAVADALTAHGFAAHTESHDGQLTIVSECCPFGDTAQRYPHVVCAVDRGMIRGMLSALYGDTEPRFTETRPAGDDHCVARV